MISLWALAGSNNATYKHETGNRERQTATQQIQPKATAGRNVVPGPANNPAPVILLPEPVPVVDTASPDNKPLQTGLTNSGSQTNTRAQRAAATSAPPPDIRLMDPAAKEQLGRYALSFVGADPVADEVWASLIYDPSLSETVREDLMEDLNENGFSGGDGSVATVDDLPLIASRIVLLEEHMPYADEFMLPHLAEAYKDLVNLWVDLNR